MKKASKRTLSNPNNDCHLTNHQLQMNLLNQQNQVGLKFLTIDAI